MEIQFNQKNVQIGARLRVPDCIVNGTDFGEIEEKNDLGFFIKWKNPGKTPQRHFLSYVWMNNQYGVKKEISDDVIHPNYMAHQGEYAKYASKVLHMGRTPLTFTEWFKSRETLLESMNDTAEYEAYVAKAVASKVMPMTYFAWLEKKDNLDDDISDVGRDQFGRDKPVLCLPDHSKNRFECSEEDPLDTETDTDKIMKGQCA